MDRVWSWGAERAIATTQGDPRSAGRSQSEERLAAARSLPPLQFIAQHPFLRGNNVRVDWKTLV